MLQKGIALHQSNALAEARIEYENILAIDPEYLEALRLLGIVALQTFQYELAIKNLNLAVSINPSLYDCYNNCGVAYKEKNLFEDAINSFDKAIAIKLDYETAYFNRGLALAALRRYPEALASYDAAITINCDYADAHNSRGIALRELRRPEEAIESFDRAIAIKPNDAITYFNRGITFAGLKKYPDAINSYDKAIVLDPDYADAHNSRGIALKELSYFEASMDSFNKAIAIKPNYSYAHYNRGLTLKDMGRIDDAILSYAKAIAIEPNLADAHWNLALTHLLDGNYSDGWRGYEWRWLSMQKDFKRAFSEPLWLGKESLKNKIIFLHSEQGLGDTIQFCRYASLLERLGAKVILEVQRPLFKLLGKLDGITKIIPKGDSPGYFDYQCPLLSLPLAFQTSLERIPNSVPYLFADKRRINKWKSYLGDEGFKIAISWQGSDLGASIGRTFPLSAFLKLSHIEGVRLISLQKNRGSEQVVPLRDQMPVETLPDDFDGGDEAFMDSAAVLNCVDLFITCDTALAHLAGALGVKTWLLLKNIPDWRWMLGRQDSPWYPSIRLFRQPIEGDWAGVFTKIEEELKVIL